VSTALSLLAGIAAVVTAIAALLSAVRNGRKIESVHVLVNQRLTDMVARVAQLTATIESSDKDVPVDPSVRRRADDYPPPGPAT